jgi:HEAT repeat protein
VRILLALAQDEKLDELVRCDAAEALGRLGKKSPQVAEALLKLSSDANANVRDAAYCALKEVLGVE